ncbi:hypothetical protein DFH05DRAFT_1503563 [Lentinula detonsa]|uniref:Uncharacterized protein n=1 Tax=Lentinula detonsa TaxID=2804962 RepID=A0A9W8NW65_9AGAR|nr:hypothetical protein DFH05DRAFT_1503563 [Lentinula detonsa]
MSDIKLSVGALVVSGWMSFMSFGLVLAFGWQYFLQFYDDKVLYKTIVTTCLLLCFGDTIVSGLWCYRWSSSYFGNASALLATPQEAIATLWFFPTTTFIVQLWFAARIWMISMRKNLILPALIAILSSGSWAIAIWMFSKLVKHHSTLVDDANLVFPVGYAWLGGDIAADMCIFGGLAYYTEIRSRKQRRHHLLSPTSLWAVTCRMIECNVLPLISQLVLIILFKTNVGLYYILSDMTIAKIYTFSLLISLHSRTPIVEAISHAAISNSDPITFTRSTINATAVQVRQDVHVVHDSEASPISPYDKMEIEHEFEVRKGSLADEYHDSPHHHIGAGEV